MNLRWLLVFIPLGLTLAWFQANPLLVFAASALAIIPLAGLMGDATESLSRFLGPTLGGLLNATLGNAPAGKFISREHHRGFLALLVFAQSLQSFAVDHRLRGISGESAAGGN